MRIFIDPGHGGRDFGNVSADGLKESAVVFDTSLRLGEILEGKGHEVNYSRTDDTAVSLSSRAQMANDWKADVFVSVHCNYCESPQANGVETWIYRQSTRAEHLADEIRYKLVRSGGLRDRGLVTQDMAVLRLSEMPAAQVEMAFLSNPREAGLLADADFLQANAQAVADGVGEYFRKDGWYLDNTNKK